MNWHKAKTILIWFLVLINALLLYFNFSQNSYNNKIDDEIIAYTADILEGNGISINPEVVPKKKITPPQFEADNIITDYESFAKSVLGDDAKALSETVYSASKGKIEFSGDKFTYTSPAPLLSAEADKAEVLSLLAEFGINITEFEYEKSGNGIKLFNRANGLEIFNSEITLENTDGGTVISGVWFLKLADNLPSATELKDVTSVLIDLLSSPSKPQSETEITALTLGYIIYEPESYHKTLVPIPVWQIEHTNGTIYLDARANN